MSSRNFSASRSGKTVHISPDLMMEFITFDERFEYDQKRIEAKKALPLALKDGIERIGQEYTLYSFKSEAAAALLFTLYSVLLPKAYV